LELTKPEVREIAAQMELVTAEKERFSRFVFIGKVRLPEFLQQNCSQEDQLFKLKRRCGIYK
jgi:tRNA-specific 2-thiouridylase